MNAELCKVLDKLGVTAIVKDMPSIPTRESGCKVWRVTLVRTIGRGQNAQELKLNTPFLGENQPLVHDVVECLIHDTAAGEQKLWDFAMTFANGEVNENAKSRLAACAKLGKRVKRFFGEQWEIVTRAEQGIPAPPPPVKVAKKDPRLKRSA